MAVWLQNKNYVEQLVKSLPNALLLIDPLFEGANILVRQMAKSALCLKTGAEDCDCLSCHLLAQNNHPDYLPHLEKTKMDDIRRLLGQLETTPSISKRRIVYLSGIEQYNEATLNALLKTLEEPQQFSHFILSAPNRRAVKATILSRCRVAKVPQPTPEEALQYVIDGKRIARQVALELLSAHRNNPFWAVQRELGVRPAEQLNVCAEALLGKESAYFRHLDQLNGETVLDYVSQQIELLIRWRQLKEGHYSFNGEDLNLLALHTLYARLQSLRRPNLSQTHILMNIKVFFLDYSNKRNPL